MKKLTLRKTNLIFLLSIILFAGCQNDISTVDILTQAQLKAESDPEEALALLSSIPDPENMDQIDYMRYIMTKVQAKFEAKYDIANDTLIFYARDYFENANMPVEASLANLFAGRVALYRKAYEKALDPLMKAELYALQTNNSVLAGRSMNNIGFLFFEQDLLDSAIVYYKKALDYYSKDNSTQKLQLQTIYSLGVSYTINNDLANTFKYFEKGLNIANQTGDRAYQATFLHQLGVYYREVNEYDKSAEYLKMALAKTSCEDEAARINISFANLYNKQNQPGRARHYIQLIESKIPEINDNYVLENIYEDISEYYNQTGNYRESLRYNHQRQSVKRIIQQENKAKELYEASMQYSLAQKQKKVTQFESETYIYLGLLIVAVAGILTFVALMIASMRRRYRREMEETEKLRMEYRRSIGNLRMLQNTYLEIMTGFVAIDHHARLAESAENESARIMKETTDMAKELKVQTDLQLIGWAKDYIESQPYASKIDSKLEDKEMLFLTLCAYDYSSKEISIIMEIEDDEVSQEKEKMRGNLQKAGLTQTELEQAHLI